MVALRPDSLPRDRDALLAANERLSREAFKFLALIGAVVDALDSTGEIDGPLLTRMRAALGRES